MNKNQITVIGRLGKNPEVSLTPGGTSKCEFSVATDRSYTKDNAVQKVTTWFRVITFGKLADVCGDNLSKGRLIEVQGRIEPIRDYTKTDGTPGHSGLEIIAGEVIFLSPKPKTEGEEDAFVAVTEETIDFPA